jgi:1-acyl-sn-glycerol-3-phosphate acyltransferase
VSESLGSRLTWGIVAGVARPLLNVLIGKRHEGFEKLPQGGFIACPNHVTEFDPLVVGHALFNHGAMPRFMAKESLFRIPVVGAVLRATGQVPVERSSAGANRSLAAARGLLESGGAIIVYPEGTLTRDPDLWPMRGRTGAARLALQTGAPVVPIAHWGAQELFPRYAKGLKPFPRKHVRVVVGDPVDLSDLAGTPMTRTVLEEATNRIMAALTAQLAGIRGEEPPPVLWDPAAHGQSRTGRDFEAKPDAGTASAADPADGQAAR